MQEECQKKHSSTHKKNCKCIDRHRAILAADVVEELFQNDSDVQKSIDLADLLVKTGYSESDTLVQASGYYREALKYYLLPLKTFSRSKFHIKFPWVEDCILLLLMVLGGDFLTMKVWSMGEYASKRLKKCYRRANELDPEGDWDVYVTDLDDDECPAFTFPGYATDDVTFQAMQLLGLLKRLNEYNDYTEGLVIYKGIMENEARNLGLTVSVEEVVNQIASWLMGDLISHNPFEGGPDGDSENQESATMQVLRKRVLIDLICDVIASIKYHEFKHGDSNCYLLDLLKGTFNKATTPRGMFGGGKGNLPQHYKVPYEDGSPGYEPFVHMAPAELWMILRDVFVQTKGLQSLLFIMMDLQRKREEEETGGHDDGDESD